MIGTRSKFKDTQGYGGKEALMLDKLSEPMSRGSWRN